MRFRLPGPLLFAAVLVVWLPAHRGMAQTASKNSAAEIPRMPDGKPDFNGVWDHPRVADVTRSGTGCGGNTPGCKQEGTGPLPFTEWGLQQWNTKDQRVDYSAHCLPWGYTRAWQVEYPVEIVQTPKRLALLFESNNIFHVIHLDGSGHPKDVDPTWMGHSVGRFEGDTLLIDTTGFNGKTWIDTAEHPSSDALHVMERIEFIDLDGAFGRPLRRRYAADRYDRLQRQDVDRHRRAPIQRRPARHGAH